MSSCPLHAYSIRLNEFAEETAEPSRQEQVLPGKPIH
jgi:hypothetical protein